MDGDVRCVIVSDWHLQKDGLPPLEGGDFVWLQGKGDAISPHVLVYEVARDYLSAPRQFVLIRSIALDSIAVDLNAEPIADALGLYWCDDDEEWIERDQCHLLWQHSDVAIRWLCHEYHIIKGIAARDARQALAQWLLTND